MSPSCHLLGGGKDPGWKAAQRGGGRLGWPSDPSELCAGGPAQECSSPRSTSKAPARWTSGQGGVPGRVAVVWPGGGWWWQWGGAACPVSRNFDMGVGFGDAGPQGWGWAPPNPTAWYLAGVGPGFSS